MIHVTNLNDSGVGSFRDAVTQSGPRIVVFDVSGTINLNSPILIRGEAQSYLTVAGQTSPGGVQLKGPANVATGCFSSNGGTHDIIIRYLRCRLGGPGDQDVGTGILIYGYDGPNKNIIIDHSSVMWNTDTQLDVYANFDSINKTILAKWQEIT